MKTYYWHIHHDTIAEPTEDIWERKKYVRECKPTSEVEIRLKLMLPVKDQDSFARGVRVPRAQKRPNKKTIYPF